MPGARLRDWAKTLGIAALVGIPLTLISVKLAFGLAHTGMFGALFLYMAVPGLLLPEAGLAAIVIVQVLYYILIAKAVRKYFAYRASKAKPADR